MQRTPSITRLFMIIGLGLVLLAPLVLYFLTTTREYPLIPSILRPSKVSIVSNRYSAVSEMPGFTIKLADTQFLDYITATLKIFDTNALADPTYFKTMQNVKERKSISRIRFVLVPSVSTPIGFEVGKKAEFLCKGEYAIDGDTLIVRIAPDIDALANAGKADTNSLEDAFFNTAIKTMQYAKGKMDPDSDGRIFTKISVDKKEYLDTGLFIRPFRIERT